MPTQTCANDLRDTAASAARLMPACGTVALSLWFPATTGRPISAMPVSKGRFGWTYDYAPDRFTHATSAEGRQMEGRFPGSRRSITWLRVSRIKRRRTVPTPLATISSSRGTNEENYLFGKFMRCVIGHQPYRQLRPCVPQRDGDRHDGDIRCLGGDEFDRGSRSRQAHHGRRRESD